MRTTTAFAFRRLERSFRVLPPENSLLGSDFFTVTSTMSPMRAALRRFFPRPAVLPL